MSAGKRTGYASLPLHGGKAPPWLFSRMVLLSREILAHIVQEYGAREVLRRMSDPFWFQAFGCVLGFDWHSSGVTTTVCGAVKESLREAGTEWGLFAAGGKGAASKKSPAQIVDICDRLGRDAAPFVHASRTAAKVDNAAVQDGYQLYHHVFLFTASGDWSVVQQGMNDGTSTARRYHWLSEHVTSFVDEPHDAVCCDVRGETLNLVAQRERRGPPRERRAREPAAGDDAARCRTACPICACLHGTCSFRSWTSTHRYLSKILLKTYERAPEDFETLLGIEGVGPKTLARARAGVRADLRHAGEHARPGALRVRAWRQGRHALPCRSAHLRSHDRDTGPAVDRAKIDRSERVKALKRLAAFQVQ